MLYKHNADGDEAAPRGRGAKEPTMAKERERESVCDRERERGEERKIGREMRRVRHRKSEQ
jgi:hypothetical protein